MSLLVKITCENVHEPWVSDRLIYSKYTTRVQSYLLAKIFIATKETYPLLGHWTLDSGQFGRRILPYYRAL